MGEEWRPTAGGFEVLPCEYVPAGWVVVLPRTMPAFRLEVGPELIKNDQADGYQVRLYARVELPPPRYMAVLTNLDGSPWPEFVNTRPRHRKNKARTTWGHQRA